MKTTLTSLSGATLREGAAAGNADYAAELARRAAKREASGHWTVAAAKSQGRDDIASAMLARTVPKVVKAKAPKVAPVAVAAPAPVKVAFNRQNLTIRMGEVEKGLVALAALANSQNAALTLLCKKLGVEA